MQPSADEDNLMTTYYVLNPLIGHELGGNPVRPAADGAHRVVEMAEAQAAFFLDNGVIALAPPQPGAPVRRRPQFSRPNDVLSYVATAPILLHEAVAIQTSDEGPTLLPIDRYQIQLTSSGNGADMPLALPDPQQGGIIGQRHVIRLVRQTTQGDTIPLNTTYLDVALVTFGAEGDWLLIEHRATYWLAVDGTTTQWSRMPWQ